VAELLDLAGPAALAALVALDGLVVAAAPVALVSLVRNLCWMRRLNRYLWICHYSL